ncbi:5'-nucleotidase C-terminal domain-containing protein [Bacillus tianshenii]|uniref:5'-nucleotidase C-terminal domain-containing protein n=1 Tax=Sutcliffiella tianshenii TaxID=1463404 RepID=UPI001CD7A2FE|nr:5'-nucleotidase C-terminal domain-containing protein [Bacillus tianshenii]MCA1320499.1 5'-nucleotidase C-terminal domain-containing protein [Bacillus tianshenii]
MFKKQWFVLTAIFTLLVGYAVPIAQVVNAEESYITVEQAIAQGSGTATVKGYIVGITLGTNSYQFDAPFNGDTNMAIADSPDETDPSKIMPVQLPTAFRSKFGLGTNPGNDGKEIVITASIEDYFKVKGLKSPTDMHFYGETPPPPPPFEGVEGLTIADIQGESHKSPYEGQNVKGVEGIVTHVVDGSNFYMQSTTPDDNPNTAEGLLVYKQIHGVQVGDHVKVNGIVKEWILDGYNDKLQTDLAMTEINAQDGSGSVEKLTSGNELPAAIVIGKDVLPPTDIVDNDSFGVFDPQEDGIDFHESLEGMRISLESPIVVGPQKYDEIPVIAGNVEGKTYTDAGGTILTKESANPERFHLLFKGSNAVVKTGDSFDGTVTGVVSYSFGNYKVLVSELPAVTEGTNTREVSEIVFAEDKLTVATYNIENYTSADPEKTDKIAKSIVENLKTPDIIGLVEVQDDNGTKNDGTVAADGNYETLIAAIKANNGPEYAWTDIAPENNVDGGAPGGNIRVGFIYNPERVTLNEGTKGTATEAVGYEDGSLTLNPGRIAPLDEAFADSRKPLAAEFTFNGEEVIVINNHFNSKGGDQGIFGKNQPPVLGSEVQRMKIANVVNGFITDVLSKNENANVVVVGDLNDFEFSNPIQALKGDILTNLVEMVPAAERYTYNYQGNAQVLDHILATNNMAAGAEADIVHLNSQFMEQHGRASDHDAVLAQFSFAPVEAEPFTLSVMHTNDSHANVDKYPRLTTAINTVRETKPNALLLDAGDVFSGTLYFNQYLGLADMEFMNKLGYDAMTLGNHEFDKDSQVLSDFIEAMEFPIVSANVNVTMDEILAPFFMDEISETPEGGKIYPAIIKEVEGQKIGIFGLTTEDTVFLSSPSEDIVFEKAVDKANETVAALEAQGVNKIVLISHSGFNVEVALAEAVDGIDLLVGGHSHTKLDEPVLVDKAEPTVVVQANEYLKYLGVVDVTFNEDGVVTSFDGELLDTKNYEEDPEAKARVAELSEPIEDLKKTVVGHTDVLLDGERGTVRKQETNLGNLVADGMLAKANEFEHTDIAIQNGGGIRKSIPAGDVTLGQVYEVLPFANLLVTLNLTGEEIWEALEHGVSGVETGEGRFLQVAGLKFKYDASKPVGDRVWEVHVKTEDGYAPIEMDESYNVATNAFTADGGDGFTMLKEAKEEGRINELFVVDYEILSEYIEHNSPIAPVVEGRIVAEEKPPFTLSVMHTNDSHANVDKYPRLTTAINTVRETKPNALLLDAGDVFSGTLYFNQYLGLADMEFMNKLGYDAMTLGNHEFDKDSQILSDFIEAMEFPIVSANVNVTMDEILAPFFSDEISSNPEGGKIYPAIIKEVEGEKIGIFGLTTEDTVFLSSPSEDIVFEKAVDKANETVAALEAQGVNKIVLISHSGFNVEVALAEAVDGIDLLVGGHSHTKLDEPVLVDKAEPTVVVQANEYLKYLGVVDVTFNEDGVVTSFDGELLDTKNYEEDPEAKARVAELSEPIEDLKKTVVGHTDVLLDGERGTVRKQETNLGNLIADGMLAKANEFEHTDIAIQNGGGIRKSIPAGDVTLGQVYEVLPFANLLVTLNLTGEEIWEALEHGVSGVETGEGRFLQVAGLKFKYDASKPVGERVWEVHVKTDDGYAPIELDESYNVATNAFTADGGDGFTMLKEAKEEGRINELFVVDYEILSEYIEHNSPIAPVVEGRILAETQPEVEEPVTGWVKEDGVWYYYDQEGNMQTGWEKVNGKWYFFNEDGAMQTGWLQLGDRWYYLDAVNGDAKLGWFKVGNKWYFLDKTNGDMYTGWVKIDGKWYLLGTDGDMKTGWVLSKNKWYYLDLTNGDMKTGWLKWNNKWYYLDLVHGDMKIGWIQSGGKWYYLYKDGSMAVNTVIDGYKIGKDGAWIK